MNKLLTIAIAAYNKEKELRHCLDSIIVPKDIMSIVQVIIVNDGSKDQTSIVAHEYAQKYPEYFCAVDKENGNYGSVMNVALSMAKGKYFRTLDADDRYDTEAYMNFINSLSTSNADMVISQRIDFLFDKNQYYQRTRPFDKRIIKNTDTLVRNINWRNPTIFDNLNVPHITYRTSIIKDSGLKWIEKIFYTDTMYDYWPLRLVKTVRFIPQNVYIYTTGAEDQSMSTENIRKNFSHFYQVAKAILEDFHLHYDIKNPMLIVQTKFILQIMSFVYGDLRYGDENLTSILMLHKLAIRNLYLKKQFLRIKLEYINKINGKPVSLLFRVYRALYLKTRFF